MNTSEAKEKILGCIISCQISTYECIYAPNKAVVPISNILYLHKDITKYRARLALRELIADGLIEYTSQGQPALVMKATESCYEELIADAGPPINGYCLTEKGFNSKEYHKQVSEWEELMKKMAEGGLEE